MSILYFHFDGTDNTPNDAYKPISTNQGISNVLKSHLLLGGKASPNTTHSPLRNNSHSFYYSGIGTYGTWLEKKLNAAFAIESGHIASILNCALLDFQTYYHKGIQHIVLIGFSRGAALARRFAALLTPMLDKPIIIEAIMDTVASIGWPNIDPTERPKSEVVFEYGCTLPESVNKALHLVALDEERIAFRPTLINHDPRALELWLPGVHSDIGGSYLKDGLGDIALKTLTHWLSSTLKHNTYHQVEIGTKHYQRLVGIDPKPMGRIHYHKRSLSSWRQLTLAPRHCCVLHDDSPSPEIAPLWHQTVHTRITQHDNYRPRAKCPIPALIWKHKP